LQIRTCCDGSRRNTIISCCAKPALPIGISLPLSVTVVTSQPRETAGRTPLNSLQAVNGQASSANVPQTAKTARNVST